jgi:hypothetical protein
MTLILVGWSPDNASAVLPFVAASVAAALDRPGITEDLVVVFAPTRANGSDDNEPPHIRPDNHERDRRRRSHDQTCQSSLPVRRLNVGLVTVSGKLFVW